MLRGSRGRQADPTGMRRRPRSRSSWSRSRADAAWATRADPLERIPP